MNRIVSVSGGVQSAICADRVISPQMAFDLPLDDAEGCLQCSI